MGKSKVYPEIKEWYFTWTSNTPFAGAPVLRGRIYGSSRFKDGAVIHTNAVQCLKKDGVDVLVRTRNSTYKIKKDQMSKYEDLNTWDRILVEFKEKD